MRNQDIRNELDVIIQDSTSPLFNMYLMEVLNFILLDGDTNIGDTVISLQVGHNIVVGNWVGITEGMFGYQSEVLNVATNDITVALPLDYAFTETGCQSIRANIDISKVVGSLVSPVYFRIYPVPGTQWDIVRMIIYIEDASPMDSGKFGGADKLTNGIVIRKLDGEISSFVNLRSNGDMTILTQNVIYDQKAPAGTYSFRAVKVLGGQSEMGAVIRLIGNEPPDEFQAIIRDNMTDLTKMYIAIQGSQAIGN